MTKISEERINKVINTTATECSEADFMLTHMPFNSLVDYIKPIEGSTQHLFIEDNLYDNATVFTEDDLLDDMIANANNHQFIMIQGKNGCGKSHLVRWLYYQFRKNNDENIEKSIFIPRSKNTLKATIRTILDANILPEDRTKYYLDKISAGTTEMSDVEFRDTVYSTLKVRVKNYEGDNIDKILKEKLYHYLSDPVVEQTIFMCEDGPIDKLCNKITGKIVLRDGEDIFENDAIMFSPSDIAKHLQSSNHRADRETLELAKLLATNKKECLKVTQYLNSLVEIVIKRTLNFSGSDLRDVFDEIRTELKKRGQKLSLFIEDINIFTGIDSEIIEVLINKHTDVGNDNLCRILSVIGSTDAFFDRFHTSLQERLTRNVVILEKSLLKKDEWIIEFAAKYINAINLSSDDSDKWYTKKGGDIPVWECAYDFADVMVNGKKMSVFPFNRNALLNMYRLLPDSSKTPRCFLKDVIKHVELKWLSFGPKIISEERNFHNASIVTLGRMEEKDEVLNENFDPISEQKEREILIKIWGNGTFSRGANGEIGDVPPTLFEFFGLHLGASATSVLVSADDNKENDNINAIGKAEENASIEHNRKEIEVQKKKSRQEEKLEDDISQIKRWYDDPAVKLKIIREPKEYICKYILENINWEHEGLSYNLVSKVLNARNIYIEGQNVSGNGIIKIDRNLESYQLFRALYNYNFYKGWDYENGDEQFVSAKAWLINHRKELVSIIKKEIAGEQDIDYIVVKSAMVYLLVKGKISSFDKKNVIKALFSLNRKSKSFALKSDKWSSIDSRMDDNSDVIMDLLNIRFRTYIGSSNESSYFYIDETRLSSVVEKVLEEGIISDFVIKGVLPNDALIVEALKLLSVFAESKDDIMNEELEVAKNSKRKLEQWLGNDIDEKIVNKTNMEMLRYLKFIRNDCNLPYEDVSLKVIYDDSFSMELLKLVRSLNKISRTKSCDDVFLLLAKLNTETLKKYVCAFEAFEKLMSEKNSIFTSNIDRSLDQKATRIKEGIKASLDSVSNM